MITYFCYVVTGIVAINLFVTLMISIVERLNDNFEGVERINFFTKDPDSWFYLIPTIGVSCGDKYLEITVSFLRYALYISYRKKYNKETSCEDIVPNDDNP